MYLYKSTGGCDVERGGLHLSEGPTQPEARQFDHRPASTDAFGEPQSIYVTGGSPEDKIGREPRKEKGVSLWSVKPLPTSIYHENNKIRTPFLSWLIVALGLWLWQWVANQQTFKRQNALSADQLTPLQERASSNVTRSTSTSTREFVWMQKYERIITVSKCGGACDCSHRLYSRSHTSHAELKSYYQLCSERGQTWLFLDPSYIFNYEEFPRRGHQKKNQAIACENLDDSNCWVTGLISWMIGFRCRPPVENPVTRLVEGKHLLQFSKTTENLD